MTAPHFFVERLDGAGRVLLSAEDSAHALRSLRLRVGEEVTLSDGNGAVARGRLAGEEGGRAAVEVLTITPVERPMPLVSVALAPPKGDRLGWAVQKLGELGVDELVLVPTERSVRTWGADRADRVLERQRAVAREAAMQARTPFVMHVRAAGSLLDVICQPRIAAVVLHEDAERPLAESLPDAGDSVRIVVGPEGGFAPDELALAESASAPIARLGASILRSETAAVVGAALVLARYGRLG